MDLQMKTDFWMNYPFKKPFWHLMLFQAGHCWL